MKTRTSSCPVILCGLSIDRHANAAAKSTSKEG